MVFKILLMSSMLALLPVNTYGDNIKNEKLYNKVITELRCMVCQNQNIAESEAPLAVEGIRLEQLRVHFFETQPASTRVGVDERNHRLALGGRSHELPHTVFGGEVASGTVDEDGGGPLDVALEVANLLEI